VEVRQLPLGIYTHGFISRKNRFHRTMTRPFFSKERISHFDVFERHADDAITQAKERLTEGYPIDFQVRWLSCLSLHSHSRVSKTFRIWSPASRWIQPRNSSLARMYARFPQASLTLDHRLLPTPLPLSTTLLIFLLTLSWKPNY